MSRKAFVPFAAALSLAAAFWGCMNPAGIPPEASAGLSAGEEIPFPEPAARVSGPERPVSGAAVSKTPLWPAGFGDFLKAGMANGSVAAAGVNFSGKGEIVGYEKKAVTQYGFFGDFVKGEWSSGMWKTGRWVTGKWVGDAAFYPDREIVTYGGASFFAVDPAPAADHGGASSNGAQTNAAQLWLAHDGSSYTAKDKARFFGAEKIFAFGPGTDWLFQAETGGEAYFEGDGTAFIEVDGGLLILNPAAEFHLVPGGRDECVLYLPDETRPIYGLIETAPFALSVPFEGRPVEIGAGTAACSGGGIVVAFELDPRTEALFAESNGCALICNGEETRKDGGKYSIAFDCAPGADFYIAAELAFRANPDEAPR